MTTSETATDIECEIHIAARPETVFEFLIQPDKIVHWMGRTAQVEARAGGLFRLDYNGSDIMRGEFVDVVPNVRVVFTWGWEAEGAETPAGTSRVEISLTAVEGGTLLHLRHGGLTAGEATSHAEGWDYFLPRLQAACAATAAV